MNVGSRHSRPIVSVITPQDAYEIYELREVIEVFVVRSFIQKMTRKDVQRLRSVHTEITKAVRLEDIPRIADAVARFYDIFYVGAGNSTIHTVIQRLMARISYLRTRSLSEPGRLAAGLGEMDAILLAIEAADADKAEAAVRIHMRNSMAAAISGLRTVGLDDNKADVARRSRPMGRAESRQSQ